MKRSYLILLIVLNLFWGGSYAAFKGLAPYLHPGEVATLRFGIAAAVCLLVWPWLPGPAPRGTDLLRSIIMGGFVFVGAPRLQVAGVQLGQAGDAAVLMGLEPLITSVAAALFLREHIRSQRWLGFSLGVLGVVLMSQVWRPEFRLPDLTANSLFVASFLCEAVYSIMGKPLIQRASMAKVLGVALIAGSLVNAVFDGGRTLAAIQVMPASAWALILFLTTVCTLIGYAAWFMVIRETEVNVTVMTVFLQPVVGVLLATLVLGETLHWGQFWGCIAIVAGVVIGLRNSKATGNGAGAVIPKSVEPV